MKNNQTLSEEEKHQLTEILEERFRQNMHRHEDIKWTKVLERLEANPGKLWNLKEMEETGGEPDVVDYNENSDEVIFCDCSKESPKSRRSLCYDRKALEARKKHKPSNSAQDMASTMGVRIMNESEYKYLQSLGNFDTKTSSWLETPEKIRELGGAVFGDFRYNQVFIYHNGAESYYASRGFRGILEV